MTDQQKQFVVVTNPKSVTVAYALLIFLGQVGLHRFYLGRVGSGIAQLLLGLSALIAGFAPLVILWVWLLVDLFLTAGMVRESNKATSVS